MRIIIRSLMALSLLSAVANAGELVVSDAYIREMPPGQTNAAAFLRLENKTDRAIEIIAASSELAKHVELHKHHHDNDVVRMEAVPSITVPAHADFVFRSGGYHVMLIGMAQSIKEGDSVPLTLMAKNGHNVSVQLPVKSLLLKNEPQKAHHNHH